MRGKLAIASIASALLLLGQLPTDQEKQLATSLTKLPTDEARREFLARQDTPIAPGLVRALLTEGQQSMQKADYSSSLRVFQFSLDLAEASGDKAMQSACLYYLSLLRSRQGEYEATLDLASRSLSLAREAGLSGKGIADPLSMISSALVSLGDYPGAQQYIQEALAIAEAASDKMRTSMFRNTLAVIYRSMGEYRLALESYEISLGLGPSIEGQARLLSNMGIVYEAQGNLELALDYYQKSLQLKEQIGDKPLTASTLQNLGSVYQRMGRNQLASDYLLRALRAAEGGGVPEVVAQTHLNLAAVRRGEGKLDEARRHSETSVSLYHTMHRRANEALALSTLAGIESARREYEQAAAHASRALELSREVADPDALWRASNAAAHAHLGLGRRTQARAELLEAIGAIESLREQVAGGEQDRERFLEDKLLPYLDLVKISIEDGHEQDALAFAERAKANVLLEALRGGRIVISKSMTAEEKSRERALLSQMAALNSRWRDENAGQESIGRAADLHKQVDALRLKYAAFRSGLYASHPELQVNRLEAPRPSLQQIAARLPDQQSAALEYVVTEGSTFLFVVSKQAPYLRHYSIHISSAELNKKVRRFSEKLGRRDLDFGADAQELYRLLVAPAEESLRDKTTLVIVPDGVLWQLPFQALATAADRYLAERSAIFYAPSLTVLAEMLRRHPPSRQPHSQTVLAVGNPAGPAAPLPEAEFEVNALREIYGAANSTILIGKDATEAAFKQQAGKFAILHVAAHAVLDDRSPLYSHLVLSPGRGSNEDGMLEAREMMDLDLKAEVVVLSACETARGRLEGGEGLIGMTWALFIAGSPATVSTSWKIDSASAARFTVEFHRSLKEGLSRASAVRQAALAVMRLPAYRHPYYWSSFSLVGLGF